MIEKESRVGVATSALDAGKPIDAYTLVAGAVRVRVLTLGGTITHLFTPDRDGWAGDVVLGFDDAARYAAKGPYFGALIGRVGNRIGHARFTLDGVTRTVTANDGPHSLHGGALGYDKRVWTATPDDAATSLTLTLQDPDGHEGYPGNVEARVVYTLAADGTLRIDYAAAADAPTPINLTNHTYFNLKDAGRSTIYGHALQLGGGRFTTVNALLVPDGGIADVAGGPLDFTVGKPIGEDLRAMGGTPVGYDHNVILNDAADADGLRFVARVVEPTTGRTLECRSTEPAVQFYSGNFLDGTVAGKGGVAYAQHTGFCLETQHYPDSVNHAAFPDTILRPGATYRSTTTYRFGVA